jgi:hypothetical protein
MASSFTAFSGLLFVLFESGVAHAQTNPQQLDVTHVEVEYKTTEDGRQVTCAKQAEAICCRTY